MDREIRSILSCQVDHVIVKGASREEQWKGAYERKLNGDYSIFLGRLAVAEAEAEAGQREGQRYGYGQRFFMYWFSLSLSLSLMPIGEVCVSSWSEKADPWKTVPASHVGSFDYPMTNPSAPPSSNPCLERP